MDPKIKILYQCMKDLYSSLDTMENLFCIEGGELTGTTSISKLLSSKLSYDHSREPSLEVKEKIVSKLIENESICSSDSEEVIRIFMEDRQKNQASITSPTIVDRGILSTVIYQSGILNDNICPIDIENNCRKIVSIAKEYGIKMPNKTIVLGSITSAENTKDNIELIFHTRRNLRGEDKTDKFDNVDVAMRINNIYSTLSMSLAKEITNFHITEMGYPLEFVYHRCYNMITK